MYEVLKELYPKGPTNRTDPIVRHDTKYTGDGIITLYRPQNDIGNRGVPGSINDGIHKDGIYYPLIRINNHVLPEECIINFVLHNDRFMPYLDLTFQDINNIIQFSDMPGLDNVITVVMMESTPTAHKPIKMNFYVTDCNVADGVFYVMAEFKCLALEKQQFKQEVFHYPDEGCKGKFCSLPPNDHPTTYEFLHVVAEQCGLGFSATQKCRSIKDDRYRILKKEKYKDLVQEHVACGGLDNNSLFDAWIDPWGMLVMANVPWIMSEEVHPDELSSTVSTGIDSSDVSTDSARVIVPNVHRILSNINNITGEHNMMLTSIEKLVDLNTGYYDGTTTEYNIVSPEGVSDITSLSVEKITETENSKAAKSSKTSYEFHNQEFSGFEMGMLTPTVKQRRCHDEYFKQQRSHMFKATLLKPNFGLERGMLCMILWFVDDVSQKAIVLDGVDAVSEDSNINIASNNVLDEEKTSVMDISLSGMYYIDGTDWEFENGGGNIIQHLYLFKKGPITQYYDKTNMMIMKK